MPEVKAGPVPRLRFPEFRDTGPWEVKRLGELINTVAPPKKLQTTEYLPGGQFPIIDQSPSEVCGWTDDETALVEADFPLVIFGDHTCVVKLAEGPFAQGADGIKILAPSSEIEARFLFLSLQADPIEQKGYKRHFSTLKEKLIPFPRKDTGEQQKIVDCLGSLDDLIRAEEGRLAALRAHKTGLMQRLFPAPGQTTPRLRFPEFQNAGPWEVKRLGELLALEYGSSLPEDQRIDGPFPVVGSNGVVGYHNASLIDGPAIVIGRKGSAGEISWIENACFPIDTTFYVKLRRPSDRLDFIKSLLEMHRLPDLVSPGGVPGLNRDDVQVVRTAIPKPEEQQKIADCLTALDDLIRAQGETIEALKTHKRGLMNRLFPREVG